MLRGAYQCKESQRDNVKSDVSAAGNYSSRMPAPKANSGIAQDLNAKASARGRMKKSGAGVTPNALNINISKHVSGIRPILTTAAREDLRIPNF